jgi:hypothetical protein
MFPISSGNFKQFQPLFSLLQVSPTYELARLYSLGERSKSFLNQLPKDFDVVLNLYEKFGSVMDTEMHQWVTRKPSNFFDSEYLAAPLQTLGYIGVEEDSFSVDSLNRELAEFIEHRSKSKDEAIFQVVVFKGSIAIPTLIEHFKFHATKGRKLTATKQINEQHKDRAKLFKQRVHFEKILKGTQLLMEKVANPSLPHWRLGARVKFSPTFDKRINNSNLHQDEIKEAQVEYGKIVYRAVNKFERMAENAARGKYPCDDSIEYEALDYYAIQKRMNAYHEWIRLNPTQWKVHPDLTESSTMEEFLERLNEPPLPKPLFEIDIRQIELF